MAIGKGLMSWVVVLDNLASSTKWWHGNFLLACVPKCSCLGHPEYELGLLFALLRPIESVLLFLSLAFPPAGSRLRNESGESVDKGMELSKWRHDFTRIAMELGRVR